MTDRERLFFYHGVITGTMGPFGHDRYDPPYRVIPFLNKTAHDFDKDIRRAINKEIEQAIIELEKAIL